MMLDLLPDLCDQHGDALQVADPLFHDFGGKPLFYGQAVTLSCYEDNSLVRATLESPGDGAVLVVDGGASLRCALVGGQLGQLGVDNGWAGIIVNGCVRDSVELAAQAIGVKALAAHPLKSEKGLHGGMSDCPVTFADVTFVPGHFLAADEDGVIVMRDRPVTLR